MKIVSEEKSWLEWVVFAFSSLLILVLLGYLVYDARTDQRRPPDLRITLGQPTPSSHGYLVPVHVTNAGDQTAQAVELEIVSGGEEPQSATLTYDFLASGEQRHGWVGFSREPVGLRGRVVGYRAE
jgi:uncharacterized protein (TIGR02588 family)